MGKQLLPKKDTPEFQILPTELHKPARGKSVSAGVYN